MIRCSTFISYSIGRPNPDVMRDIEQEYQRELEERKAKKAPVNCAAEDERELEVEVTL